MRKSGESGLSAMSQMSSIPGDWEVQLDLVLQRNNERLIEKLQHSMLRTSVADRLLTGVTTDSAFDPYQRISTGTVLGPVQTTATATNGGVRTTVHSIAESTVSAPVTEPGDPRRSASRRGGSKSNGPGGPAGKRRQSMTSMTSEEETQHVENLKNTQMQSNRDSTGKHSSGSTVSRDVLEMIRKIVATWWFEAFYAFAILSNSVCIGAEVHYAAHNHGKPLPVGFFIIDQSFSALFFIEILLRILAEGKPFFWSSPNVAWNYLDILVNITSLLNLATFLSSLDEHVNQDTFNASGNVRVIRILRLTRVIRVVRIVKIVRFIRALRSLVYSIFGTLKVLLWSVLLLFMIMYVFAIVFTDVANEYAKGFDNVSDESLAFLKTYFFDLERSILTLFESICNGLTWGEIMEKLNSLSRIWGYLYLLFIAFCLFAVLNVMTGMFCQSAIESAERDQELHIQNAMNNKQQQVEMFMSIFHLLQQDRGRRGTGNITFMDFEQLFDREQIRTFFQALDVEAKDAWTLFKLMDTSGNGDLDASEFVDGCMRLKGPARSIDVSILLQEQRRMRKKLSSIEQLLWDVWGHNQLSKGAAASPEPSIEECAL